jgi:hypothetical protein
MCSLHADRLQEGRQADGSDCTWKSWGNGDVFKETYEVTIDKGATSKCVVARPTLDFTDWDENNGLKNIALLPEHHLAVKSVLSLCVVVGAAVASLCTYIMPEHAPPSRPAAQQWKS